jgi:preprotein translocase SecE subunit
MGLMEYFRGVRAEFDHITWPTQQQAIAFTVIVIIISLIIGAYLGLLDQIFARILEAFVI